MCVLVASNWEQDSIVLDAVCSQGILWIQNVYGS